MPKTQKPLTIQNFTEQDEVRAMMRNLKDYFDTSKGGKAFKVSDVLDEAGNQYVNLVQEGGGVLGITLVGYTWALEQMGVRFWRLAGTSAGAINALLLAAVKEKHEAKSEEILEELAALNLLTFVDGHPFVPGLLLKIVRNSSFVGNALFFVGGLFVLLLLCLLFSAVSHSWYLTGFIGVLLLCAGALVARVVYLFKKFKANNWGLCEGENFKNWLTNILKKNGVNSLKDLKKKAYKNAHTDHLSLAEDRVANRPQDRKIDSLQSDLTMISCDITNQMKVEFPRMMPLYGLDDSLNPAELVRASMSIPLFYEPHCFNINDPNDAAVKKAWEDIGYTGVIHAENYFVDGGAISNFPINVFHRDDIRTPRLPVFAADLFEGELTSSPPKLFKSFLSFAGAIIGTIRGHHDKEFLAKHHFYKPYITVIDVKGFNWLNFAMKDSDKQKLFTQGVKAAKAFLMKFNWEEYKKKREELYDQLNPKSNLAE